MTPTDRADAYLGLPDDPDANPGRLRWSPAGDAVVSHTGHTLAVSEEVRQLLSGLFGPPRVPPFPFVMALYEVLKGTHKSAKLSALGRAYRDVAGGRPVGLARNAGLLLSELCRGIPIAVPNPGWDGVAAALGRLRVRPEAAAVPVLWEYCEDYVAGRLARLGPDGVPHWLKFGRPPVPPGPPAAAEPPAGGPRALLALARRRPRLAGAAALVPALDAAAALPPRRRSPDAVPQGGYADVTTRGDPARLLPSQFALDPDDFVRRFAGSELLYFKREEPHDAPVPERWVVLDQGVRAWGGVRLALAAAALSLLGADRRRAGAVRLVTTAGGDPVDPAEGTADRLADRLEASDLSPHPADALDAAVSTPGAGPRDLILLTHPRNRDEPPVAAAAGLRGPGDRLFALTVDGRGRAELSERTAHGWRPVRGFRLDLAAAEAARSEHPSDQGARPPARAAAGWAGDVEPVGFPFRAGLVSEPEHLGFDAEGGWLVAVGRDGVPHGLAPDGSPPEVWPRAYRGGAVLKFVDAVLGVSGGVVLCGRLAVGPPPAVSVVSAGDRVARASATDDPRPRPPRPAAEAVQYAAAHYDLTGREVRLILLGPAAGPAQWSAYPDLGCVAVRPDGGGGGGAVDLATLGQWPGGAGGALVSRAMTAWGRSPGGGPPFALPIVTGGRAGPQPGPALRLAGNTAHVDRADPPWGLFEPRADGRPLLAGRSLGRAVLAGDVLAVSLSGPPDRKLVLFRGPTGAVAREVPLANAGAPFALSPDGRRLAVWRGRREVVVADTVGPAAPAVAAGVAGLHNGIDVGLDPDPFRLVLRVGSFEHHFELAAGRLTHSDHGGGVRIPSWPSAASDGPSPAAYDPSRFPPRNTVTGGRWRAVPDRLGQVVLFGADGGPVAAFAVRRNKAAAWLPDGTVWGDVALIGGPPTPGADRMIAEAITAAGGG